MRGNTPKEAYYTVLAGEQALRNGIYRDAIQFLERALTLVSEPDANALLRRQIYLRHRIGEAQLGLGEYTQAKQLYEENLTVARNIQDQKAIADALLSLGDVASARAEYSEALRYFNESLPIYRELNDQGDIAKALDRLGGATYELGKVDEAKSFYQESLNLSRESGSGWGMAGSIVHSTANETEQYGEAEKAFQAAIEMYQQKHEKRVLLEAFQKLFGVSDQSHEFGSIFQLYERTLDNFRKTDDEWAIGTTLHNIGRTAVAANDLPKAQISLREALRTADKLKNNAFILDILVTQARLLVKEGQKTRAIELLALALRHPDIQLQTEDEAEHLVFEMDDELEPGKLAESWEKGKALQIENVIGELMKQPEP